jgi:hypothetical protein
VADNIRATGWVRALPRDPLARANLLFRNKNRLSIGKIRF